MKTCGLSIPWRQGSPWGRVDKTSKYKVQKILNSFHLLEFFSPISQAVWRSKAHFLLQHLSLVLICLCFLIYFSTMFSCNALIRIQIRKWQWVGCCFLSSWTQKRMDSWCLTLGNLPCSVACELSQRWAAICSSVFIKIMLKAKGFMLMQTLNFPGQHFEEDKDFLTIQQRALDLFFFFFGRKWFYLYNGAVHRKPAEPCFQFRFLFFW